MKLPDNYVQYRIGFNITNASFNLLLENKKKMKKVITSLNIGVKTQLQVRPRSNLIGCSIKSIVLKPDLEDPW